MYEYTDVIISYLNKRFIGVFGKAKALSSFDELNVLQYSHEMYGELEQIAEEALLKLAQYIYNKYHDSSKTDIDIGWLLLVLSEYNAVTKYIYLNEVERKRSRFAESVIASDTKIEEIERAMRLWAAMVGQYAIEVTDAALLQAYVDNGVEKVIWVTTVDERRCVVCAKREGKTYDINKIPAKPHIGCRCFWKPYPFGGGD